MTCVELHVTIAALYSERHARQERQLALECNRKAKNAFATYEPDSEEWDVSKGVANVLCLWMDPFWEGVCVPITSEGRFEVRHTLRPLPIPEGAMMSRHDAQRDIRTLCNSIKMHFFLQSRDARTGETRREFLYASAFPLSDLMGDGDATRVRCYGAFNYNRCDVSPNPLMGMRIAVCANNPMRIPGGIMLLGLGGPQLEDHVRVMALTEWIQNAFTQHLRTKHNSPFCNMRTTFRNQHSSGLFQDIPALFALPWTELPFSLGLYALLMALLLNGQSPVESIRPVFNAGSKLPPRLVLRIVRDALTCFTVCHMEGIYWPDVSLGSSTEDQPFPLSFMPSDRVFAKDDCEGRVSQAQMMKLLFQCMHRRLVQLGSDIDALLVEVVALKSFHHLLGEIKGETVRVLLCEACALGERLDAGAIDLHTTVGDVHFGAMGEKKRTDTVGHSFAVAIMRHPVREALVAETTGWERIVLQEADRPMSSVERAIKDALMTTLRRMMHDAYPTPNVCGRMTEEEEASMYERMLLGHGCLYFTAASPHPHYGIGVNTLRSHRFEELWQGPTSPTHGFSISTRSFLTQLCTDEERAQMGDKTPRLWPSIKGARLAVDWYDTLQEGMALHRRCLRPPPKTQAHLEALIQTRWTPITEKALCEWRPTLGGVLFSLPDAMRIQEADVRRVFAKQWPAARIQSLPFMSSRIFQIVHQP